MNSWVLMLIKLLIPILLPIAIKGVKHIIETGIGNIPNKLIPILSGILSLIGQALVTKQVDPQALAQSFNDGLAATGWHQVAVQPMIGKDPTQNQPAKPGMER